MPSHAPPYQAALFALLGVCVPAFGAPHARPTAPAIYDVAVVTLTPDRALTATYTLDVRPARAGAVTVTTTRSQGEIQQAGVEVRFDSDAPSPEDPWPLRQQHAISSAPLTLTVADSGALMAIADERGWLVAARLALGQAKLPDGARAAGEALLDPVGVVADLRRVFPGYPGDTTTRTERLGNLAAVVTEQCTDQPREGKVRVVRCEGTAAAAEGQEALLHDTETWLELRVDRRGLVELEQRFTGTIVRLRTQDGHVVEAPMVAQRLVRRR